MKRINKAHKLVKKLGYEVEFKEVLQAELRYIEYLLKNFKTS